MRPWRQPFCRQCFFRYSEAHFHPFHTFSLIITLFHKKVILSAKTGFVRQKVVFCVLGHLFGSFSHPCANLALDNGFFGVLSSIFLFLCFWSPFSVFSRQNALLAPKIVFGAKKRFWNPKIAFFAFWQPASQPASQPARQAGRQVGRQAGRQTDRQTDRHARMHARRPKQLGTAGR